MSDALPPLLLQIDPHGAVPPAQQLIQLLRRAAGSGALPAGLRLPPSRELADQLGLARHGVVQAYAQLLAEGWLDARGRLGTFIAARPAAGRSPTPLLARRLPAGGTPAVPAHADWRLGQASSLALPLAVWRTACREAGRVLPPAGYGDPRGDAALREAIAGWLARHRAVHVSPQQVIVTPGAAQGIELLARVLLRPGDVCVVENPGYRHAAQAFARQGAEVLAVPVDAEGLDVDAAFAGGRRPALLHVTAARHYPLGMRLSGARRQRLLEATRGAGTLVIENEYDHEFIHSGTNHAPLFASAPGRTVLVSTFAKAVSPSLRLGFIVATEGIAERLAHTIEAERRHVSWPVQRSVAWLLSAGELDRHLRRVRRHGERLGQHMAQALAPWAPHLTAEGPLTGPHVLLRTNTPAGSQRLATALQAAGVALDPLEGFCLGDVAQHGVLFAYGHMEIAALARAMGMMGEVGRDAGLGL